MKLIDLTFRGPLILSVVAALVTVSVTADAAPKPRPPSKFCVDEQCAADKSGSMSGKKWHPGHYMLLDGIRSSAESQANHFKQIDAIANEPSIRGVKLWLYWGAIEKTEGDYSAGYTIIDAYLKKLSASNKYLILSIQDRQFGGFDPKEISVFFPSYIVNGSQYGTTKMRNGLTTRTWQQPTMDRVIALSKAMAKRYDGNPNFEMYQTEETAVAVTPGTDGFSIPTYATQLKRLIDASAPVWDKTVLRLSANFFGNDQTMADMISYCAARGVAIGGPDVIPNQTIQANRVFAGVSGGGRDYRGYIPWIAEIQSPSLGGHEGTFTPRELYDHGKNEMNANYFVWYRNTWQGGPDQKWDSGILPFIKSIKGAATTNCPEKLGNCTT